MSSSAITLTDGVQNVLCSFQSICEIMCNEMLSDMLSISTVGSLCGWKRIGA